MSGIAGLFGNINDTKKDHLTNVFNDALVHRGPDGAGEYYGQNIFLFHRRLSIIDIETGDCPLYFYDKNNNLKYVLVVDGEIYNYIELKKEFEHSIFKTSSDCEVILHLYEKYNTNFSDKIRGMYALALYDVQKRQLVLSRDHYGIKPLYFSILNNATIFASNTKAILNSKLLSKEALPDKAYELLQARFNYTKQTIFKNIYKLLPGETLIFENNQIVNKAIRNTVDILLSAKKRKKFDPDKLTQKITHSTRLHLRSDKPIGIFFRGNVDSQVLLYWMKQFTPNHVNLFTINFTDLAKTKEQKAGYEAIAKMGFKIHKVDFGEGDFWKYLFQTAQTFDDPIIDPKTITNFKLSEEAKKHVKVVLTSEGGDEFFSGYKRHHKSGFFRSLFKKNYFLRGLFPDKSLFAIDFPRWQKPIEKQYKLLKGFPWTKLQKLQILDCLFWLPYNLLLKLDKCSMANSLEVRTPFIDQKLSTYALSIPNKYKVTHKYSKWCLRQHLDNHWMNANAFRKTYVGKMPIYQWLDKRRPFIFEYLNNHDAFDGIFNRQKLTVFLQNFSKKHDMAIFGLIFFSLWYDHHIKNIDIDIDNDLVNHIHSLNDL
ncbi:asparagine synthase (glutamine-hydrolyzing) [Rickettsiales bacterium]|nr:asparagine synthase (glutamine-hydrolyzing) [Rickettsiales bacterium]